MRSIRRRRSPGRIPAISEETVATGMLSASPAVPEEDVDTIGLEWLLVAQSRLSTTTVSDLARIIYENKAELALDRRLRLQDRAGGDRQGRLHRGASGRRRIHQRRHQVLHRALQRPDVCRRWPRSASSARSLPPSTPRSPGSRRRRPASSRPPFSISASGWNTPRSLDALDELQDELEAILRGVVIGLRDGTISSDGLDTFKLGYEFVRDEIGMRREHLKRHAVRTAG